MEIEKIPCFLCGYSIEVKNTVKGKPYFICDPCGLQAFIRITKGPGHHKPLYTDTNLPKMWACQDQNEYIMKAPYTT